jgi:hypothetical protein
MAELSGLCLKKVVMHCARHSGQDVIGALSLNDAFPMFHTRVTTGATEVCLTLLKNEKICGFYESRIRPAGQVMEPSRLALNLAQALKTKNGGQVLIVCVENDWERENQIQIFTLSGNSAVRSGEVDKVKINEVREFVSSNVEVFDFDDHFANIEADWKNPQIN